MEKWLGQPVDYSNLRVFGCLSFMHVRNNKLQPRVIKCLFLGYPEGIKGYKIWDLTAEKCIISKDVIFKKDEFSSITRKTNAFDETISKVKLYSPRISADQRRVAHHQLVPVVKTKGEKPDVIGADSKFEIFEIPTDALEPMVNDKEQQAEQIHEGDLGNYNLTDDRAKRTIKPPKWFGVTDIVAYVL